jgi:glycolate oxidase iron-sulfur subunit
LDRAAEYVEMDEADACCGGAGTFGFLHYPESMEIGDRKADSIERAEVDALVTGCPGCLLQIEDRLAARDSGVRCLHTVQVLAESIRETDGATSASGEPS